MFGRTNGVAPGAGQIGEYISSIVTPGAPVGCPGNNIAFNITSINLTPGYWLVWGEFAVTAPSGSEVTLCSASVNPASGGLGSADNQSYVSMVNSYTAGSSGYWDSGLTALPYVPIAPCIANLSVLTTYYLVGAIDVFTGATYAFGKICALRIA